MSDAKAPPKTLAARAFEALTQFLEEDGWHPQGMEGLSGYRLGFAGKNARVICIAEVDTELDQFLFYVLGPVLVPPDRLMEVAELVCRANFGMRIGNFELDFDDGEVRFKTSLDFEEQHLTTGWIRNCIYPAVHTFDHYLPALLAVLYGNADPEEAINAVEGREEPDPSLQN